MNTKNKEVTKTKKKLSPKEIGKHLYQFLFLTAVGMCLAMPIPTLADGPDAETMWSRLTETITLWVGRLGGVVIFVGGVMFALGWKSEDAEQKSRGISTIIAGAMVVAVSGLTSTFFA